MHLEANARYALMASVKQISSNHSIAPDISTVNLKPDYTGPSFSSLIVISHLKSLILNLNIKFLLSYLQ